MSNINEELIKDRLTKTCPCQQVSRHEIKEAIKSGATTVDRVAAVTGATTGRCNGCRCRGSIEDLIQKYTEDEY
ncbi:(2Fe-2S)-binding protein [Cellulosilyticum ruminicola]|uniref:(2Fe-2S)-binding protein n=1 Tax=Cellulosilyticum ruminicola TaxID=425254 RepID=UPI0006D2462F|nr:(2Fe-2S)-binding protein [Cellulosilyticum ruminicola]